MLTEYRPVQLCRSIAGTPLLASARDPAVVARHGEGAPTVRELRNAAMSARQEVTA